MAGLATEAVDPDWKGLYRTGGVSMLIIGVIYFVGAVLSGLLFSKGLPRSGEAYLESLSGQTTLAWTTVGLFALTDLLLIPVLLALYLALKGIDRNAALMAAGFTGLFIALDLGVSIPNLLSLATLSGNYAAATSVAQRAAYAAVADYAAVILSVSVVIYSTVVWAIGILINGIVMLKGIFSRAAAYLGIAIGILGITVGILAGAALYLYLSIILEIALFLFGVWGLLVGSKLYQLGRR